LFSKPCVTSISYCPKFETNGPNGAGVWINVSSLTSHIISGLIKSQKSLAIRPRKLNSSPAARHPRRYRTKNRPELQSPKLNPRVTLRLI
jgi:hypothetical protein